MRRSAAWPAHRPSEVWLLSTDADSTVARDWADVHICAEPDAGADAVAGHGAGGRTPPAGHGGARYSTLLARHAGPDGPRQRVRREPGCAGGRLPRRRRVRRRRHGEDHDLWRRLGRPATAGATPTSPRSSPAPAAGAGHPAVSPNCWPGWIGTRNRPEPAARHRAQRVRHQCRHGRRQRRVRRPDSAIADRQRHRRPIPAPRSRADQRLSSRRTPWTGVVWPCRRPVAACPTPPRRSSRRRRCG